MPSHSPAYWHLCRKTLTKRADCSKALHNPLNNSATIKLEKENMPSNFFPPRDQSNAEQLEACEDTARGRIAGWWQRAGLEPAYPCDTETVVALLRAVEYRVDGDAILGLITDRAFPEPQRVNGRIAWTAVDVVDLARACEARRMWAPFSRLHHFKFSHAEKIGHLCDHAGGELFNDLDRFDFAGLIGLLVENSHVPQVVEMLALAIKTKMQRSGVL
jgi:hypothetical protein